MYAIRSYYVVQYYPGRRNVVFLQDCNGPFGACQLIQVWQVNYDEQVFFASQLQLFYECTLFIRRDVIEPDFAHCNTAFVAEILAQPRDNFVGQRRILGLLRVQCHGCIVIDTETSGARITSYNVCYTKLLRIPEQRTITR